MKHHRLFLGGIFLLLVVFAILLIGAQQTTLTADEPTYIALGYGLLARGPAVFPLLAQRGYPPLLIALEALPFYLGHPHIPVEQLPGWATDYATFTQAFAAAVPLAQMKLLARLPIIWLAMLLGAVVWRWGKDLWGSRAGLLALGVLSFDPLLLAHGRLANSDAGAVVLGTAVLYATWRWRQRPAWRWAVMGGVMLGLTLLAKVSGLLWGVASGVMVAVTVLQLQQRRLLLHGFAGATLSLLILWLGYGFEWGPLPNFPWPVPAPTYWQSLLYLDGYTDTYFALGWRSSAGWWWYFPLAFLIKNPLPLLIGLGLSLIVLWQHRLARGDYLLLAFFPALYTGVAIVEALNLGYRFMLPLHPFFYLAIGGGLTHWLKTKHAAVFRRGAALMLAVWYVGLTLRTFPYEISFFNELVGGPDGGYRYLSDSNVDWGQARDVVQAYAAAHPEAHTQPPAASFYPGAGQYIVTASYLQGIGLKAPEAYAWFRQREPTAILAHSALIYDGPERPLDWAAQCERPAPPLDNLTLERETGQTHVRLVNFDCSQMWLYPNGGQGLYALHHDLFQAGQLSFPTLLVGAPTPKDLFLTRRLADMRLSYEQANDGELPAFVLYESSPPVTPPPLPSTITARLEDGALSAHPLTTPIVLEGPLALLGVTTYTDHEAIIVETWWQVVEQPDGRPFSIMAHLLSATGEELEVADGLGVSPNLLNVGDVIVQRHPFARPASESEVALLTGAYWLDTLERWNVKDAPQTKSLLAPLEWTD